MIRGHFAAKILKTRGDEAENKTKARGELFASSFRENSRRFDEPVACESRDEFCVCTIEN